MIINRSWFILDWFGWCKSRIPLAFGYMRNKSYYRFLEDSQWWTKEQLESYQLKKLKELLEYAAVHVPYYRDLFQAKRFNPEKISALEDLQRIPVLTKQDIVHNFDKMLSDEFLTKKAKKKLVTNYTSGSTGTPMMFLHDEHAQRCGQAFYSYRNKSAGLPIYAKRAWIGATPFRNSFLDTSYLYMPFSRVLFLSSIAPDKQRFILYLDLLKRFKPLYVMSLPSLLYDLACCARESAVPNINFNVFFSISENLYPFQQDVIEQQFKCKTYNYYSSQELHNMAIECDRHEGLHIEIRHFAMEILDSYGNIVESGKRGRIVCTGLTNRAMPLIRYDTGDIGAISPKPCSCGRGLPLLFSLDGRQSDVIVFKGRIFYPTPLSVIIEDFPFIKECQFVQDSELSIMLNIVPKTDYSTSEVDRLIAKMKELISQDLKIDIKFVASIPRTKMGKYRFIINSSVDAKNSEAKI